MTMKLILPQKKDPHITIDTGVNIGIALWDGINKFPMDSYVIKSTLTLSYDSKLSFVLHQFKVSMKYCWELGYKKAYIEKPSFRDTGKGLIAARGGQLFKLIKSYVLEQYLLEEIGYKVIEILPEEWKGQLDKSKVDHRIKLILNQEYPEHVSDAVGMGLWLQGLLGPKKKD